MRIARRRSGFHPGQDGLNLRFGQRRVVGEMAKSRVGEPRRHHFALNRFGDGRRPWPGLIVGHQGHGCDLVLAVATLTVFLKNGENVLVKSWLRIFAAKR